MGLDDRTRISSDYIVLRKAAVLLFAVEYAPGLLYQYPQCSGIKLSVP